MSSARDVEDLLTHIQLCQALATLQKGDNTSEHLKLHAICDSPEVTAMQELCTHAALLEAAAKTMSRYQKGTLLWENAVKSFWHIDNIDTPSLKSSCKKYALMFHPDKLTSMSHTTKCVSGYRDKLIGIYAGVIEPQFRQLFDYFNGNPGEMHCQTWNDVKHLIIRKDEQITLLILRIPIIPAVLWQWLNEFQDVRVQMEMRSFIRKAPNKKACCRVVIFLNWRKKI